MVAGMVVGKALIGSNSSKGGSGSSGYAACGGVWCCSGMNRKVNVLPMQRRWSARHLAQPSV